MWLSCQAPGLIPNMSKAGMVAYAWDPREVEAKRSGVLSQPWLRIEWLAWAKGPCLKQI